MERKNWDYNYCEEIELSSYIKKIIPVCISTISLLKFKKTLLIFFFNNHQKWSTKATKEEQKDLTTIHVRSLKNVPCQSEKMENGVCKTNGVFVSFERGFWARTYREIWSTCIILGSEALFLQKSLQSEKTRCPFVHHAIRFFSKTKIGQVFKMFIFKSL